MKKTDLLCFKVCFMFETNRMGLAPNKLLSNCPNIDTDIPREDINHGTQPHHDIEQRL